MKYTAAVLRPTSALLLKWIARAVLKLEPDGFLFETPQGEPLPHHMTLNLGAFDDKVNPPFLLGKRVLLSIRELHYNHTLGVCAAPVVDAVTEDSFGDDFKWGAMPVAVASKNKCPHITVCLKPHSAAKFSNKLLEEPGPHNICVALDQTYTLEAVIEEVGS